MTDYKVAIDIGGTDIKAAVLDNGLNFVDYQKYPHRIIPMNTSLTKFMTLLNIFK